MNTAFEVFTAGTSKEIMNKATHLGLALTILSECKIYSSFQIRTLQFWIEPAINHRQFLILFDKHSAPIGYITWAHLAIDSERRLLADPNFMLHPSEWNEGGQTWIIDMCFPYGGTKEGLRELKKVFRKENIVNAHWVRRNSDYSIKKICGYHRSENHEKQPQTPEDEKGNSHA